MTLGKKVYLGSDTDEASDLPDIIKAAYARDSKTVALLVASGVDVNTVDPGDNITALHIACMNGDAALVQVLLDHDAVTGAVDFTIRSRHRPRLAWQFAMNAHHYEIGRQVDAAALAKSRKQGRSFDR